MIVGYDLFIVATIWRLFTTLLVSNGTRKGTCPLVRPVFETFIGVISPLLNGPFDHNGWGIAFSLQSVFSLCKRDLDSCQVLINAACRIGRARNYFASPRFFEKYPKKGMAIA